MKAGRIKKTTLLKFLLLVVIIFIFLQGIFVSWAQQYESPTIKKELILPTPTLPIL